MKLEYINEMGESIVFGTSRPIILQRIEGFGASKNNITMVNGPYQNGSTVTSKRLEYRELTIEGTVLGSSRGELADLRRHMIKVLNPGYNGYLIYRYGRVEKKIEVEIEYAPVFSNLGLDQQFVITMLAPSPFWEDIEQIRKDIALWIANFEYPISVFPDDGIEIEYRMQSLIAEVHNDGDRECGMVIELRAIGNVVSPSIINLDTREFYKLDRTMDADEVIRIDTRYGKKEVVQIIDNTELDIFSDTANGSEFLQLNRGVSYFRYDADSNIDNLEMSIYYTPLYLGV